MIYSFLYLLVFSWSIALIELSSWQFSPAFNVLFGSLIALVYFNLINLRHLKYIYATCLKNIKGVILLNVLSVFIWVITMYAPGYIGASYFCFLSFSVAGILGMSFQYHHNKAPVNLLSIAFALILVFISLALQISWMSDASFVWGVVLTIFAGVLGFTYLKASSKLMQQCHFSVTQIIAVRFFFLVIFGVFLLPHNEIHTIGDSGIGFIILIAVVGLIAPIQLVQKSVQVAGPEVTAIVTSAAPFVTGIFQLFMMKGVLFNDFVIYALYALAMSLPYLVKLFGKKKS